MEAADIAGKCVLVIEDNPLNMRLFTAMLNAQGLTVLQAGDGQTGVDLAYREQPDLIIADINLPGISGLDATQILKEDPATRDIPIIVTSAYEASEDEIRASRCDAFLAKPISVAAFLARIEELISHAPREPRLVRRLIDAHTTSA